ncbi:acyl-CoA-binding domain-containing protein [Aspergillus fumigatus Af293]|uniref:Acyl CoA binding protein family n=3 Tax=Aspergillus fumigatus TaxID=746128 RepID=Q4X164_ASPFU|nr:Acyl CoA binding protein family [Aspergillus fumigatus Af293]EAL93401.1 Acyl CoA binding protein family [Aspergillus fumigatus Af293]EDP54623.1 Acyl CoA binding protein family [Aspergillus fumigatus A1163]KEY83209.1 acyl CoA binding protein [Aspergillus fumigatus]
MTWHNADVYILNNTMASLTDFFTAFDAAASKEKFTPALQSAAASIDKAALQAALDAVLAGGDDATAAGNDAVLKAGFEFATELVKMLEKEPGPEEKLGLYKYFKQARGEKPAEPSFYQMEAKFKYNAWKEISHISAQKAQALYIKQVNDLINKYGTRA